MGAYSDDDVYSDSGSAYLFRLEANGTATFLTKVTAPDANGNENFGYSVSQSGDILAVGAYADDDVYTNSGSAYLFRLEANGTATFLTKVTAPDANHSDILDIQSRSPEIFWRWEHIMMTMSMETQDQPICSAWKRMGLPPF